MQNRWNSFPTILDSVLRTKTEIFDTLSELNQPDYLNDLDIEAIEALSEVMKPIKMTVEALSRKDASLVTADAAIYFMYLKLEKQATNISKRLLKALKEEIGKRETKKR